MSCVSSRGRTSVLRHSASLYWLRPKNIETLNRIRTCFLPLDHPERTTCPRRPLIITSYWYSAMAVDPTKVNGEALWLRSLVSRADSTVLMSPDRVRREAGLRVCLPQRGLQGLGGVHPSTARRLVSLLRGTCILTVVT